MLCVGAVGEIGQLLDHHQVQRQPITLCDLAGPVGQQGQIAVVQLGDELLEDLDGLLDIRADEPLGAALPDRQLDQLGIEQDQLGRGVQGSGGDEELGDGGLATAWLGAEQQVALGQQDLDLVAVLVLTHRNRRPQRAAVGVDQRPGDRGGIGQRITPQHHHPGMTGAGRIPDHPDLPDREEGGDPFGLGLQIRHLGAGRHPDPELLPGPGEPTAGDAGDAVIRVASSAWRQANAHRRRWERNRAWASGSRVQVTIATTRAAATINRSAPARPSRSPSHT
jgi:hypothetical protein